MFYAFHASTIVHHRRVARHMQHLADDPATDWEKLPSHRGARMPTDREQARSAAVAFRIITDSWVEELLKGNIDR